MSDGNIKINYPDFARDRGMGFWLQWNNIWASRRKIFRSDYSTRWRYAYDSYPTKPDRSKTYSELLHNGDPANFRFIILGDTGEGDRSQYATLPLIKALRPEFMIINGDVVYPAGRSEDYIAGFFEPYRGLDIPIWAVPGNHEYYSKNKGKEFYEIFCTRKWAQQWQEYNLRLVPQPATFWELRQKESTKLVLIGVDTGQNANLDGHGRLKNPDHIQHVWLEGRLRLAQIYNLKVIVLFHIPMLGEQKHIKGVNLRQLHQIISRYDCVKLVIGAHYHNYQRYSSNTFKRYLDDQEITLTPTVKTPEYIVSGGGGASLHNTNFHSKKYLVDGEPYPTVAQWLTYEKIGRRILDRIGMTKNLISTVVGRIEKHMLSDFDAAGLLSFLLVEVKNGEPFVYPIFMDNIQLLFSHLPPNSTVDIMADNSSIINQPAVKNCTQNKITL